MSTLVLVTTTLALASELLVLAVWLPLALLVSTESTEIPTESDLDPAQAPAVTRRVIVDEV